MSETAVFASLLVEAARCTGIACESKPRVTFWNP